MYVQFHHTQCNIQHHNVKTFDFEKDVLLRVKDRVYRFLPEKNNKKLLYENVNAIELFPIFIRVTMRLSCLFFNLQQDRTMVRMNSIAMNMRTHQMIF